MQDKIVEIIGIIIVIVIFIWGFWTENVSTKKEKDSENLTEVEVENKTVENKTK